MHAFTVLLLMMLGSLSCGVPLTSRDVWNPPITNPNEKTVWKVGDKVTVTWDVSSMPTVTRPTGTVLLGFLTADSENLMIDTPLATDFNLTDAQVQFTVPSVPTRNNYIVVVLGDSGNASPQFTIQGADSASTFSTAVMPSIPITTVPISSTTSTSPPSTINSESKLTSTSPLPTTSTSSLPTTSLSFTSSGSSTPASTSSSVPHNSSSFAWKTHRMDLNMAYSLCAIVLALLTAF